VSDAARFTAIAFFLGLLGMCLAGVAVYLWNSTKPKGPR
jgi:hypothetical protein